MDNSFTFTDYLLIFFYYMQRELECCDLMAEKFRTLRYGRADPGNPDCECDGICNNPVPIITINPIVYTSPGWVV